MTLLHPFLLFIYGMTPFLPFVLSFCGDGPHTYNLPVEYYIKIGVRFDTKDDLTISIGSVEVHYVGRAPQLDPVRRIHCVVLPLT